MATTEEKEERNQYLVHRTQNILSGDDEPAGSQQLDVEKSLHTSGRSSSDGGVDAEEDLQKTYTRKSTRERTFEPINSGDRAELTRIASTFGPSVSLHRSISNGNQNLERTDTLAGITLDDEVLDPKSANFDVYKWTRM